ncbi:MAG TPA: GNAT family N-acetyltransferase [bacterium]|nr:GNAT family N-acetyltransferase [bacterium]
MNSIIRPLTAADRHEVARVYAEAFAADEPLWQGLLLPSRLHLPYWEMMTRFYFEVDEAVILGVFVDGSLAGVATGWDDTLSPPVSQEWLLVLRYWRRMGLKPLSALRRFLLTTMECSKPTRPCLRLYVFGVDQAHRGAGLGRALLAAFEEKALERSFSVVQLECEEDNPARLVYESCGYTTERTFSAIDIQWHVMTKELA